MVDRLQALEAAWNKRSCYPYTLHYTMFSDGFNAGYDARDTEVAGLLRAMEEQHERNMERAEQLDEAREHIKRLQKYEMCPCVYEEHRSISGSDDQG